MSTFKNLSYLPAAFALLLCTAAAAPAGDMPGARQMWFVEAQPAMMATVPKTYIVINTYSRGTLLKVHGAGRNNLNEIFNLKTRHDLIPNASQPFTVAYLPQNKESHVVGVQDFECPIADVKVVEGNTLVAINCGSTGYLLKVSGLGGTGYNMFGVDFKIGKGWSASTYYTSFYLGDFKSDYGIHGVAYARGNLFVHTTGLLKFKGSGGFGRNMFGIKPGPDYTWVSLPGSSHLLGQQHGCTFKLAVKDVTFLNCSFTLVKIQGNGGGGQGMFNTKRTSGYFERYSDKWPNYLLGQQEISVSEMHYLEAADQLLISTDDDRMLLIEGLGGEGRNMFNIIYDPIHGFRTYGSHWKKWLVGSQTFEHRYLNFVQPYGTPGVGSGGIAIGLGYREYEDPPRPPVHELLFFRNVGAGNNMFALKFDASRNEYGSYPGYNKLKAVKRFRGYAAPISMFRLGGNLYTAWADDRTWFPEDYKPRITLKKYTMSDLLLVGKQEFFDLPSK